MAPGDETVRLAVVNEDERDEKRAREDADEAGAGEETLAALEAKLESAEGISGLATWLREVEEMVSAVETDTIAETRNEIREVIDKLLEINAEVQNLLRLKKLLS